ncbi:MAG: chromate efflux transporter [Deltaproteobacteria bacterium]|nr:chromate efflux transporter [Deltaproteobacteria bacterium]
MTTPTEPSHRVPFREALAVWTRIGLLGFGGPAGQVALLHRELVETRRWVDEARFLHALNYCMLLPGPEAQQLATYLGWLLHRTPGAVVAGTLFVLPGALAVLALSALYAGYGALPAVAALFFGLKPAVLAVVLEALLRVARRALTRPALRAIAALAFLALFAFAVPFPVVVFGAGALGLALQRLAPLALPAPASAHAGAVGDTVVERMAAAGELAHTRPSLARAARVLGVCGLLWAGPLLGLRALFGPRSVVLDEGLFFSRAAVVTFGGAYAVLAYVAQRAVDGYHWLLPGEMVDGLGLAETTPGPLILVLEFVGFLGAYRHPGGLPPMAAGTLGAAVTVWTTFVPCFLWILLGAPYLEALRGNRALQASLSAITAAVVGVILNLSLWFGLHVLFRGTSVLHLGPLHLLVPTLSSADPVAWALALLAVFGLLRLKLPMPAVLVGCAALGALGRLAAG